MDLSKAIAVVVSRGMCVEVDSTHIYKSKNSKKDEYVVLRFDGKCKMVVDEVIENIDEAISRFESLVDDDDE